MWSRSDGVAMMSMRATAFLALAAMVLLAGCGFHLRGDHALPEQISPVQITGIDRFSDFHRKLRFALMDNGIGVSDGADARTQLVLQGFRGKEFVTALDREGKAAEYELSRAVRFSLREKATGQVLVAPRQLERRGVYADAPLTGFGITLERQEIIAQLEDQLVDDILSAISFSLR
jgi:LPS-assembly lipoprotein